MIQPINNLILIALKYTASEVKEIRESAKQSAPIGDLRTGMTQVIETLTSIQQMQGVMFALTTDTSINTRLRHSVDFHSALLAHNVQNSIEKGNEFLELLEQTNPTNRLRGRCNLIISDIESRLIHGHSEIKRFY